MKTKYVVGIIIPVILCIFSIMKLYFIIKLPYNENGRYFDEFNGIIYKSESIIFFVCLLILCILLIIYMILIVKKNNILNRKYK